MTSTSRVPSTSRIIVETSISELGMGAAEFGAPTSGPEASRTPEPGSTDRIACHWSGMRTRVPLGLGRCSC
jgi:hypothetical protein